MRKFLDASPVSLTDETPIYRIFNLFDLISTLDRKQLRLAQASRMTDSNELLGSFITFMNSTFGPMTADAALRDLEANRGSRRSVYMTCWSLDPDNIALWSLYSPDLEGVMVATTLGKLKQSVGHLCEENDTSLAFKLPPNHPQDLFYPPTVGPVLYADLSKLFETALENRRSFYSRINSTERKATDYKEAIEWLNETTGEIYTLSHPHLIKDARYSHEKEIRATIQLARRDSRTVEEWKSHPMYPLGLPLVTPDESQCPPNIFTSIGPDFVDDIQIDGRLPLWKREAVAALLLKYGYTCSDNQAFLTLSERDLWEQRFRSAYQ